MFREVGGCAAWFIMKEYVTQYFVDRRTGGGMVSKKDMQPLAWESAVSGAAAGAAGALILYPADTVKSAIQTEEEMNSMRRPKPAVPPTTRSVYSIIQEAATNEGAARRHKMGIGTSSGFWSTFAKMYRTHGVKGLYTGCGMTVARAIPSSGIIFVVYDGLNNWVG
jgi:ornithine carrier protein